MEIKFKVGDVVRLKSGGPEMTIEEIDYTIPSKGSGSTFTGYVYCKWFIGNELKNGRFHQDSLNKSPL